METKTQMAVWATSFILIGFAIGLLIGVGYEKNRWQQAVKNAS
jgi:hypothetical protein